MKPDRLFTVLTALWLGMPLTAYGTELRPPPEHREATDQPPTSAKDTVEGKILTIEQDAYVVREDSGKTVRLYFDKDTSQPGHLTVGDKILAQVNPLISVAYAMTITRRASVATGPRVSVNPVSGEVLKVEGQSYWIKDGAGKEVRIFIDDSLLNDLHLSVGDTVLAQVINIDGKPTRYVASIKKR
jgi:hypothetical protein